MEIKSIQDFVRFKYHENFAAGIKIRDEYRAWQDESDEYFDGYPIQIVSSKDDVLIDCTIQDVEVKIYPTHDSDVDALKRSDRENYRGGETHEITAIVGYNGDVSMITKKCIAVKGCKVNWDKVVCAFKIEL